MYVAVDSRHHKIFTTTAHDWKRQQHKNASWSAAIMNSRIHQLEYATMEISSTTLNWTPTLNCVAS